MPSTKKPPHTAHPELCMFPPLTKNEGIQLEETLKRLGQLDPIEALDTGEILGGWEIYEACRRLGIDPVVTTVETPACVVEYVVRRGIPRQLTEIQRACIAVLAGPKLRSLGRQIMRDSGRRGGRGKKGSEQKPEPFRWEEAAAELVGAQTACVKAIARIFRKAPDVFEKLRGGELNLADARHLTRLPTADERASALKQRAPGIPLRKIVERARTASSAIARGSEPDALEKEPTAWFATRKVRAAEDDEHFVRETVTETEARTLDMFLPIARQLLASLPAGELHSGELEAARRRIREQLAAGTPEAAPSPSDQAPVVKRKRSLAERRDACLAELRELANLSPEEDWPALVGRTLPAVRDLKARARVPQGAPTPAGERGLPPAAFGEVMLALGVASAEECVPAIESLMQRRATSAPDEVDYRTLTLPRPLSVLVSGAANLMVQQGWKIEKLFEAIRTELEKWAAYGAPPGTTEAIATVMGTATMTSADVVVALDKRGWLPGSDDPKLHVAYLLSNRDDCFERVQQEEQEVYKVRCGVTFAKPMAKPAIVLFGGPTKAELRRCGIKSNPSAN